VLLRSLVLADPGLNVRAASMDSGRGDFRRRALALIREGNTDAGLALFTDTVSGAGTWERMVPGIKRMMRDNVNTLIGQAQERGESVDAGPAPAQPTLLLGGAQSPAPFPAVLDALAALLPGTQRATIPAASHAMNLWNPRAFNRALDEFLAGL
jgi:pimeloyl-ACP methyl ester carboxylesterase